MQRLGVAGHAAEGQSRKSSGCLLLSQPTNKTSNVASLGHTRTSLPQNLKKEQILKCFFEVITAPNSPLNEHLKSNLIYKIMWSFSK